MSDWPEIFTIYIYTYIYIYIYLYFTDGKNIAYVRLLCFQLTKELEI